ncbi:YopX family protein [Bacillus subtilis]|uniref:YopX family protein n=1 Tax=Bacillus subtilis TaxID=1423 RepID=UPI0027A68BA5|nr:YopX family protein [Bacillus subtilis]WEZ04502.1 YopX family protein [Bacillus subtilis]
MNTAYRVWDGKQMYHYGDEGICLSIGELGSIDGKVFGWSLWLEGYGVIAHSGDGKSVLMWGTDQKGIYDGDVVLREETMIGNPHGSEVLVGVVSMIEGQWCIVNTKTQETRPLFSETAKNTILGGVYQNPELLEGVE